MITKEKPPAPVADKEIKETISADVVVVGAGLAGLCAALSAAEAGAGTVLIEKRKTFSARGMHFAAIGTKTQKELGVNINKEQAIRELIRWFGHRVKESLHWLWADKSGQCMDWIIDMTEAEGMETTLWAGAYKGPDYYEYPGVTHMFIGPSARSFNYSHDVATLLEKNAKIKGVTFYYRHPATQLIRGPGGRVTGVIAKTVAGEYKKFSAQKAVILCTGDYSGDQDMISKYCPIANKADTNIAPSGVNTGDGHKMGLWVGAAMQKDTPHAPTLHTQSGAWSYGFLHVNKNGERYSNEDITPQSVCIAKMMQQDNIGWSVYDDKFLDLLPQTVEIGGGMFWDSVTRRWGEPFDKNMAKERHERHLKTGLVVSGNTIEELAQKMKVPADKLAATVARYNELVKTGKDVDFGKRPELLFSIDKPPFFAGLMKSALLAIVGGLSVNNNMQVLDTEEAVIPGLYAAGNTAGDFFAVDYPTIFPGHSHGRAITFGRLAGLFAAGAKTKGA